MDKGDHPWLAKVDLEAVETRTLTEIKFKLETGADVTVISEGDYKNVGRPKRCESTKTLLGANQTNFVADCREETPCWRMTYMSVEGRRGHY